MSYLCYKLYLDPLKFGRGHKRIYFLLGRTKHNIPEPHIYLRLVFLCFVSASQQRLFQCCFYLDNMQLTWVCETSSAFEKMGGKKVGVSIFFQKSGHSMTFSLTFSPTPPYYLSLFLPCIMLKGRVSSLLQKASLELAEDSL